MKHALLVPPSGELCDPHVLMELAVAAEAAGWDGFFVWDHLMRPPVEPGDIADPWIVLAAIATATSTIRIGSMITPPVRRRPQVLAKQATTLDHLSGGRLTLGLGLGVDSYHELSGFGEVVDARARGDVLDEAAELLVELWSGEEVHHRGPVFAADGVRLLPVPVQQPRIPLWFAARGDARRPVRRAARYDGLFPVEVDAAKLGRMVELVVAERGSLDGFDVCVELDELGGADPTSLGVTWALVQLIGGVTRAEVAARIASGPN